MLRNLCGICHSGGSDGGGARIKCVECNDLDICVLCFSEGAETSTHKPGHKYRVVEKITFPIYESGWGADEEWLLLEAIELYGLGNWAGVGDHLATKTKEECEQHYHKVYLQSPQWPLAIPLENVQGEGEEEEDTLSSRRKGVAGGGGITAAAATTTTTGKRKDLQGEDKPVQSQPYNHEVQGFMPGRCEFETEHDNEAEAQVKEIYFNTDEPADETELKLTLLDIYNRVVDNRLKRRKFVIERGLVEYKKTQAQERKLDKEDRDLLGQLKAFARMLTEGDFKSFSEDLLEERRIRQRIGELQDYRLNGIRTFTDAQIYELNKAQRRLTFIKEEGYNHLSSHSNHHHHQKQPQLPSSSSVMPRLKEETTLKVIGRKPANPLDISNAEDIHLLSEVEAELCSTLRILPRPYLVIKEQLLHHYARKGHLRKREARELIKIDVNKTARIYDFFVQMGWIKLQSATGAAE